MERHARSTSTATTSWAPSPTDAPPPKSDPLGLYASIDGHRSVAELVDVVGATETEVTRELAKLVDDGHATLDVPAGEVAKLMRELEREAARLTVRVTAP